MRTDRGFTLLELLVAFVIAALALGVLFRGAADSERSVAVADRYEQALARAQSRLATVGHGLALAPLHQSGEDGYGFSWDVAITPAGSAPPMRQPGGATNGPPPRLALYDVQVGESWVTDDGPRHVRLHTERIGTLP